MESVQFAGFMCHDLCFGRKVTLLTPKSYVYTLSTVLGAPQETKQLDKAKYWGYHYVFPRLLDYYIRVYIILDVWVIRPPFHIYIYKNIANSTGLVTLKTIDQLIPSVSNLTIALPRKEVPYIVSEEVLKFR